MKKILLTVLLASGLVSANATITHYVVALDGPSEFPTNNSAGVGVGTVAYDNIAHTLQLQVTFSGLSSNTTASHIHAPTTAPFTNTAGVATTTPSFVGFPLGVTSGFYSNTLDLTLLSSYNIAFVNANGSNTTSAEAALISAFNQGKAYWNIHTMRFPSGEIRGFLVPQDEPPVIHSVMASPSALHPPNHRMVPVMLTVNVTDDFVVTKSEIISVTSNEPPAPGESDWEITGPLSLNLRAERAGKGEGRIYTITVRSTDDGGNSVTDEVEVTVPKGSDK